jgi:superfamily II DNA helicase RecQ
VLERIASLRPTTLDELSTIKGVGPKKLRAYGPALVEIITSRDGIQSTESD